MGGGNRGSDAAPAIAALVGLLDRPVIVAATKGDVIASAEPEVVARALASAVVLAASRAALERGAVLGTALGDRVSIDELRACLVRGDASVLRLLSRDDRVELAIYAEEVPPSGETSRALHRESRRWAHDLANTFMTVTGHAQLLRKHVAPEDASGQRSLDRIVEAIERANALMRERTKAFSSGSE